MYVCRVVLISAAVVSLLVREKREGKLLEEDLKRYRNF